MTSQLVRRPKERRRFVKPLKDANPITVAIVGILILLGLIAAAGNADVLPVIGGGTDYSAYFSEAAGIKSGNEVRVAGVKVGKVTGVKLETNKVKVSFRVKNTWVGDASTATIMIKTLLGGKFLMIDPLGYGRQNSHRPFPLNRTVSPYDVTTAFNDLGTTMGQIDSAKLAQSMRVISDTFEGSPPSVRKALDGLSALSKTISSRDAQLAHLFQGTKKLSATIADQNDQFEAVLRDGNQLLAELNRRRAAIGALLKGTNDLAVQLSGLVRDNQAQLGPALTQLEQVADVLQRNQKNLGKAISLAAPYVRLAGNFSGNGRWLDGYLCGTIPKNYLIGSGSRYGEKPPDVCQPEKGGGR